MSAAMGHGVGWNVVMRRVFLYLVVVVVAGCGAEDEPEPFAHLKLRAGGDVEAYGDSVRVAVVWRGEERPITDDRRIETGDVAELALAQVPPEDVMVEAGEAHGRLAYGSLIAYRDRDGDGGLDWTPAAAPAFRDEVIGWVLGLRLVYAETPTAASPYQPGINRVLIKQSDQGPYSVIAEPDEELELRLFDVESSACFGLLPGPRTMTLELYQTILDADAPTPGNVWPYDDARTPCPNNELPADWWRIGCGSAPDQYVATQIQWPASEEIGALCGFVARYCTFELPAGATPPPEYPTCD